MALISEVNAAFDLVAKATKLMTHIQDGYYKGTAEVDAFPAKVLMLKTKQSQWNNLLQRFGMTEDEHLKPLVAAATEILDKEDAQVQKMKRSRWLRSKRRAFPAKLTNILNSLQEIVDAGPQLLATRVGTNDLLERSQAQRPAPLPFGPDRKYVPLLHSIKEVRQALEDADGPPVVTIHGGPGLGKSSLVKYLALQYQEQKQQMIPVATTSAPPCFPDGVFYLLCGRGAQTKIKQLQMDLLESLGGGLESLGQLSSWTAGPDKEGDVLHLPSHQMKLRFRLSEQRVLIILDDVWEVDVLKELQVPGRKVKYLVTSQIRTICSDATMIELKSPNIEEARKILVSYTEGLPIKDEFPANIQSATDSIIKELECHPLSLASIGTTINRRRATDPEEWEAVKDGLQNHLDDIDFQNSQHVYGTTYPLTVGASMMLMVDSLRPEARHLLLLAGLLNGPEIPEVLVKFLFNQIQPTDPKYKYRRDIKYLEDRSLVEYHCHSADHAIADEVHICRPVLAMHGLRIYYIRKNRTTDIIGIATKILSGGSGSGNNHGGELVESGSTDEALATIMGSMYFEKPFRDVVATKLQSQYNILNGGIIPRCMNINFNVLDLMDRTHNLKYGLESLVWLLNPDGGGGWKQQAHHYAKKIMINLTVRKELDDESMAGLIQLPQTTILACQALQFIVDYYLDEALEEALLDQNRTFSRAYGETMKSLLYLLHDNAATRNQRIATVYVLGRVLCYERDDIILPVAKKWVEFLGKGSNLTLQSATASAIAGGRLSRATILLGEFPRLLDHLLMLVDKGRDSKVQGEAAEAIWNLCESSTIVSKSMAVPYALEILFKKFLSTNDQHLGKAKYDVGRVLIRLSFIPENRVRFTTIHDGLKGLIEMLTSSPGSWSSGIDYSMMAAKILANLAMTNEVRKFILTTFPEAEEGFRLLQLSYVSRYYGPQESMYEINTISRGMTILNPLQANPTLTTIPLRIPPARAYYQAYLGRVRAYRGMRMYSEALASLNNAHAYYQQMPPYDRSQKWELEYMRPLQIFLKTMLEDYDGAMLDANNALQNYQKEYGRKDFVLLGEIGVLKRLAGLDLVEALADLHEALKHTPT